MSPTRLPVRRTLVVPPRDLAGLLGTLSVFESLSATGRLVMALVDSGPAALLYATLLHLRMRDRPPEDVSEPLCLHRDDGLDFLKVRQHDFREAVLLSGRFRDASLVTAAGIERRWGYAGGLFSAGVLSAPRSLLLRPAVTRPKPAPGWIGDDGQRLLEAMDVDWRPRHTLHATESWVQVGRERLERAKIPMDATVVGIYVGRGDADWMGARGSGTSWPDERWLELLQELRKRRPKWRFVLVCGEKELWRCVQLHEKTGRLHPVIGPDLGGGGIAAVLHSCELVIGRGDTWPVQVAAAVGTRVCALFDGAARRLAPPPLVDGTEHLVSTTRLSKLTVDEVLDLVAGS